MAGSYSKSPYMEGISFKAESMADMAMIPMAMRERDDKLLNQADNYLMEYDKQDVGSNPQALAYYNQKREELNSSIADVVKRIQRNGSNVSDLDAIRSIKRDYSREVGPNGGVGQLVEINKRLLGEAEKHRKMATMHEYDGETFEGHIKDQTDNYYNNVDLSRVGQSDFRLPDANFIAPPPKKTVHSIIESKAGLIGEYGNSISLSDVKVVPDPSTGVYTLNYGSHVQNTTSNINNLNALNNLITSEINNPDSELMKSYKYRYRNMDEKEIKAMASQEMVNTLLMMIQSNQSKADAYDFKTLNTQTAATAGKGRSTETKTPKEDEKGVLVESQSGLVGVNEFNDPEFLSKVAGGELNELLEKREREIGRMKDGPEKDKALAVLAKEKKTMLSARYKIYNDMYNPSNREIVSKALKEKGTDYNTYVKVAKETDKYHTVFTNSESNLAINELINENVHIEKGADDDLKNTVVQKTKDGRWFIHKNKTKQPLTTLNNNNRGAVFYSIEKGLSELTKDKGYSAEEIKKYVNDSHNYKSNLSKIENWRQGLMEGLYGKDSKADVSYKSTLLTPGGVESNKLIDNLNKSLSGSKLMDVAASINTIAKVADGDNGMLIPLIDYNKEGKVVVPSDATTSFDGILDRGNLPSELLFTISYGSSEKKETKRLSIPLTSDMVNHDTEFGGMALKLMQDLENGLNEPYKSRISMIVNNAKLDKVVLDQDTYNKEGLSRGGTASLKASRNKQYVNDVNYKHVDPYKNIDKANIVANRDGTYKVNYTEKDSSKIQELTFGKFIIKDLIASQIDDKTIQSKVFIKDESELLSNNITPEAQEYFVKKMFNLAQNMSGGNPLVKSRNTQYGNNHQEFLDYIHQGGVNRTLNEDFTRAKALYMILKNDGIAHKDITKLL